MRRCGSAIAALAMLLTACSPASAPRGGPADVPPAVRTDAVPDDPDDPALWVHPSDPSRSLILGTNKVKAPSGAVVVFGLDGKTRQTVSGLDRPNNIDVEYGFAIGGGRTDIAVAAERLKKQLRVFRVSEAGIEDITSAGNTRVFADRSGEEAAPMGVALYRRPSDGVIFAVVAPKAGPRTGSLGQYRLDDDGSGRVKATFVRHFGTFSGAGEIEAVAVDDEGGYIYYADEGDGIHKYHADPAHPQAAEQLAHFGRSGFQGDRDGIAIYKEAGGRGYIVCTDQIAGNSEYRFYPRDGVPGQPHAHDLLIKVVRGGADGTDGLEIVSRAVGPQFPNGLMIAMNSSGRNFRVYRWDDVAGR